MKKLMFTLAAFAVAFTSANAQKQLGGEHNVEVSFNPFGANPINASVIKYRNFLDDDAALRVTLGLNNTSNRYLVVPENSLQSDDDAAGTLTHRDLFLTNDNSRLDLGVGYEKHFKGTDNLSPYIAFGAGLSMNTLTLSRERFSALNLDGDYVDTDTWQSEPDPANWGVWSYSNEIKSTTLNFDLLFGADYYFNDAIYVGFEAGLRYARTSGITSTITASDNNAFNIYFDGGEGNPADTQGNLVVNTVSEGQGFLWNSATEVNYVINGQPWLGDGVTSVNPDGGPADQAAYIAADDLWYNWTEQSPATQDAVIDANGLDRDPARDAFFSGSNFLGMYSTGMLRIGYLFE